MRKHSNNSIEKTARKREKHKARMARRLAATQIPVRGAVTSSQAVPIGLIIGCVVILYYLFSPSAFKDNGIVPDVPAYYDSPSLTWHPTEDSYLGASAGIDISEARFVTRARPMDVLAFYQDAMPKAGWTWKNTGYVPGVDKVLYFGFIERVKRGFLSSNDVEITAEATPDGHTNVKLTKTVHNKP